MDDILHFESCITQNASLLSGDKTFETVEGCKGEVAATTVHFGKTDYTFTASVGDTQLVQAKCSMNDVMAQADNPTLYCGDATLTKNPDGTMSITQHGQRWVWKEIRDAEHSSHSP